ncbi:MAG: geranylgeranyl reductase family protein [Propionibacteriaceae bacterium]|jgi:geranylgeranyl reductase family protein|nr:geranylgeranyl reductase family protein [Propionibacteriaceae bacterium]
MSAARSAQEADVCIVGAGPAGSSAAAHLAALGLDVLLLEKTSFPREKVCGDGLTPRAVKQLVNLGIDISDETLWRRNKGLRVFGGRVEPFELPWPDIKSFPDFGLTLQRSTFDKILADHAVAQGARLHENTNATEPIVENGRVVGVKTKTEEFRAPVVVAADGNSSRIAASLGVKADRRKPMGVAVRAYYKSERSNEDWMESWLELWDGEPNRSNLLPGYGWVFPLADGTCNVGLGVLNQKTGGMSTREMLSAWLRNTPEEWGFTPENQIGKVGSAALPMAFNREPHYKAGLLLVGDSGGMVSPFNGEGIPYALEAGALAAEAIADAKARGFGTASAENALRNYETAVHEQWGGYYKLGQIFVALITRPAIMRLCTRYGLPRPTLMRLTMKLLSHLYDESDGDWMDRLITAAAAIAGSTRAIGVK